MRLKATISNLALVHNRELPAVLLKVATVTRQTE